MLRKVFREFQRRVDFVRDEGFRLRVWVGPLYIELFHDKPTKEVTFRCLYGEE